MKSFFITAAGTDIGKTLITTTLCWQLRQQGKKVTALKPVITGFDAEDPGNDVAMILKSCKLTPTPALMETISPWQYASPLAPSMASNRQGKPVELDQLLAFCHEHVAIETDFVLVEGVGGVMVPLNAQHTVLDWMERLEWPVILVGGSYLGSISHTLTAFETLKTRGLKVRVIIICESDKSNVSLLETVTTLEKFIPADIPIVKLPRKHGKQELWKQMPLISWLVNDDQLV